MTPVTRNLIGNFVGRGVAAALSLLLVPVYIRFLGVEAYGLVAFFVVLQSVFSILDFGLTTTTHREIALRVAEESRYGEARDLLRTVEAFYWPFGVVIGAAIAALAPLIARRWLHPETVPIATLQTAIMLMGLVCALQWPYKLYEGVLHGLQRIVAFNAISGGMQIVRGAGAVLVVWIWPDITAFFVWQAVVSAFTAVLLYGGAWSFMPRGARPVVRLSLMREIWRFAAGMTATATLGIVLTQSDRLILSRMLPLETFGYYSVAATVAVGLMYLMAPISLTVLPRFTELLAKKKHEDLVRTYHVSSQLMAVVITPVALVLALFSWDVIALWTRSAAIADRTSTVATILVMAVLLFTLLDIPYMLQLAQGRAKLAVYTNLAAVALYVPLLLILVPRYGLVGGAVPMLVLYTAKLAIWGPLVHSVILPGEGMRWYVDDVARPALAATAVTLLARLLISRSVLSEFVSGVAVLGIVVAGAAAAAIAVAPLARSRVAGLIPLVTGVFASRRVSARPPISTRIDR